MKNKQHKLKILCFYTAIIFVLFIICRWYPNIAFVGAVLVLVAVVENILGV